LNQNKEITFIKEDVKYSKRLNDIITFTENKIKESDHLAYKYIQIYNNRIWYGNQTIFFCEELPIEDQKNFDPSKPISFRFLDKIDFDKPYILYNLNEILKVDKQKDIKPFKFHYFTNDMEALYFDPDLCSTENKENAIFRFNFFFCVLFCYIVCAFIVVTSNTFLFVS
jgi:hypothetical protein